MRITSYRSPRVAALLALALAIPPGSLVQAQSKAPVTAAPSPEPPPGTSADPGWPRPVTLPHGNVLWYQPQIESWPNQKNIVAWSAVAYTPTGAKEPALGTIKIEGPTLVSVDSRVVNFEMKITEYNFKSLKPDQVKTLVADVQALPPRQRVLDLDRILAYVADSPLTVENVEGIKADPPKVFSAAMPAVLMNLDGNPIWSPIKEVDLKFAVNTNWDLFEYTPGKTYYARYNSSWLQAPAVSGPWQPLNGKLPDSFSKLPADENWKEVKAAVPGKKLSGKAVPKVFVSTTPAELIALEGNISYLAVEGAPTLLWVSNTESDLFRMGRNGDFYFLVAGRWFRAPSLEGPWTFATPTLPDEFKKIRIEHPRSRVLASVPGTPQATEAVLLAQIPRTARVNRKELKAPAVDYAGGKPEIKPIEGSNGVQQVVNTDKDIVKFGDLYYMCFQGVWFVAKAAEGPWEVASNIPKEIYTIPTSSPVNHVTYVTIEEDDDDDEWVTFAYVAAYTGLMVGWGCAVWGSGYYYPPYGFYGGYYPIYHPYPHTYGMGAWYNPYTGGYGRGAGVYGPYGGVGMGASYNPRTGTYARGAAAYGPYGSRSAGQAYNPRTGTYAQTRQGSNVYGNWGTSSVQRGDNWAQTAHRENYRTGTSSSGIRTSEGGGAVSRSGPGGDRTTVGRTQGGDIYAGHDGNVYRRTEGGGWEQSNGSGSWSPSDGARVDQARQQAGSGDRAGTTASGQSRAGTSGATAGAAAAGGGSGQLDRDSSARTSGNTRTTNRSGWESSGGTRSGAGSYGGSRGGARGGGGRRR
jgi:hypothetical protein